MLLLLMPCLLFLLGWLRFPSLQNLPLLSGGLCTSNISKQRIAAEQQDDFRLLQIQLIAAYMETPLACVCDPDDDQPNAATAAIAASHQGSNAFVLLQQLQRLVTRGATVCCTSSLDDSPVLR